jgi:sugar lactone lactonase YvrE
MNHRIITAGLMSLTFALTPRLTIAAPGDTVKSYAAPYRCPQGLTFDGEYLWSVDRRSDMIYRIDPADGRASDSIPAPGYVPRGLTWGQERLWCIDAEESAIYAVNPDTRIVEKTIYCPVSRPTGLAWDGEYLWIAGDRDDRIRQISSEDGTTIRSIPSPTKRSCGLTYDGTYMWVCDRYKDMIYMVTPENGDVIISFSSPGPHPWGLAWDGSHLWSVDYQTDRLYELIVDDGTAYSHLEQKEQNVEFVHQVRNFGPDTVQTLDVYLAIPGDKDNQELAAAVVFEPEPTDTLADQWEQKVAHFRFTDLAPTQFATVKHVTSATLFETRYYLYPDKVGATEQIPESISEAYLIDDAKFSLNNPIIQAAVQKAVGDETNLYWIGRKIYNYVIDHVEYELSGGWNVAPVVLERGTGSCSEYSFVYIAMCRAAGLPARYAGSIAIRGDDASYDEVFHRWVEIYLPNYGWIPVDPSRGDSESPAERADSFGYLSNRLLVTTLGGGGSDYLGWGYNANERWTSKGRCKVVVENFAEWTPIEPPGERK